MIAFVGCSPLLRTSRRFLVLIVGLAALLLSLATCRGADSPTPTATPLVTWTPTPPRSVLAQLPSMVTPAAPAQPDVVTPTQLPTLPSVSPSPIPNLSLTPTATATTTTAVTPQIQMTDGRIDVIGPVALPTVAPLPLGTGERPIRLSIPALGLDVPVEPMGWRVVQDAAGSHSEWEVVDDAAGHHINSAYPGEAGNVVMSGHNNMGGSVFKPVSVIGEPGVDFGLGDAMIVTDQLGRRFTYAVNGWWRLEERNASSARQEANASYMQPTDYARLTLVTCWPPWSNTHRVIVTGLLTAVEDSGERQ